MKTLKKIYLLFAVSVIALMLLSCKEDPVTPPNPPEGIDTLAMYEWTWDTISGYFLSNIYVADTSNIYFEGTGSNMVYYNGQNYEPIPYNDPTFSGKTISGFNQNNVFVTGSRYIPPGPAKPCLKVWNGSTFTTYEFPNDSGDVLGSVTITGYNQGWACNNLFTVYFFNNGNFTEYRVDSLIASGYVYITKENETYLFTSKIVSGYHAINIGYKLINNDFVLIYRDSSSNGSTPMDNMYFPSQPYFFRGGHYTLNLFNNGQWSQFCNTYNFEPYRVCSSALDSVFCYGQGGVEFGNGIFLWNGIKWILEKNLYDLFYGRIRLFPFAAISSQMFIVDKNIYLNFSNFNTWTTYLLKGKPLHRKEGRN